jgi:hypothetical protein
VAVNDGVSVFVIEQVGLNDGYGVSVCEYVGVSVGVGVTVFAKCVGTIQRIIRTTIME